MILDDFWQAKAGPDSKRVHAFDMSPQGEVGRAVCGVDIDMPVNRGFSLNSPNSCGNCVRVVHGKLYPTTT